MPTQGMIGARTWSEPGSFTGGSRGRQAALALYRHALLRGWLRRLWLGLTGRSGRLDDLADIIAVYTVHGSYDAGVQTVSISQIQGSRGRRDDFDNSFYPLRKHGAERWVRVAMAREMSLALPPVKLIRIGEIYFVHDGHHRLSVAQALGQVDIEAEVEVWRVTEKRPNKD